MIWISAEAEGRIETVGGIAIVTEAVTLAIATVILKIPTSRHPYTGLVLASINLTVPVTPVSFDLHRVVRLAVLRTFMKIGGLIVLGLRHPLTGKTSYLAHSKETSQLSGETTRLLLHQNGKEPEAPHLMAEVDHSRNAVPHLTSMEGDENIALHLRIEVDFQDGVRPDDDPRVEDATGVAKTGTVLISSEAGQGHLGWILQCINRLVDDLAHSAVMS